MKQGNVRVACAAKLSKMTLISVSKSDKPDLVSVKTLVRVELDSFG